MAVLGRLLVSSAERLDLPDLLSVDSYAAGDWKYFLKGLVGDSKPFILKGFDVIDPANAIGTQSCSIRVADSVTFYPGSSSGSFFHGLAENHPQAAPLVPELRKNAVNYVYLTFSTFNTSVDTRAFWDPDKDGGNGGEFTQDINTESVLQVQVNVSTGSFPANTVPIAKITVGPVVITAIEDARDLMFRLGSGGINPNPFNTYAWRSLPNGSYARQEPATTMLAGGVNPFQGADKNILTLKEWMDAIMSKLRELGGTTYWYDDTSSFGIITNFFDAVATAFKSKGKWVHDTITPGLLTWTEDVHIKMTSDPRTYVIRQGSKQLANEQVMYMAMVRNQLFNPTDENVSWTNGQPYINTIGGAVGLFANLAKGDYVKKAADGFAFYVRVEEFYDAINLGGSTTTAAGARSVRLSSAYLGTTGNEKGRYDKGAYLASDIIVSDRSNAAIANTGGNFHWLAIRSDTIDNISNVVSHTLSLAISEHDGSTAKVTSTAHGLVDGDRITIDGTTNFDGTYQVEVETANIFYITLAGGPFADESGTGYFATITTSIRNTPYGFQEESANHGFSSNDTIEISNTVNYDGSYLINVLNATSFTIPIPAAQATETAGDATLARIIIRSEGGSVDLIQGQVIDVGGSIADNIRSYLGMGSLSETAPSYAIAPGYNTLDGMQNYNGIVNENITARVSKLTAMMADKAQDKTIRALPSSGITSINNTQNGAAQEITFTPPGGSLTFITPGSDGQAFVALPGTAPGISLLVNQAAYVTIDRNNPTTPSIVVADIADVPVGENVFLIAVRLLTNDVYLWEGSIIQSGGAPGPGYDVTVVKQNQTLKLVEGGDWSWDLGTETVTWSADAFIQVPGLANSVNQIVAGSAVLNAGEVAYVNINRSGVGGALAVNIATNASLVLGLDTIIIARRETTDVIVGAHSMRLVDGESKKIYAGTSNQTLTFIGALNAGDAAPDYSSTTVVSDGMSLVDAISALDAAAGGSAGGSNQDRLMKLVGGGIWSWNSGTGALVSTASSFISVAGLLNARNEISAQTINLTTDGDAAYVTINRTGVTPAVLTVTVAPIASVPVGGNEVIIARRVGANIIVGNHSMLLVNGESKALYAGMSDQNLAFIGAATEATSAPSYSSDIRGAAAQNLMARIGVNTDAIGDEQEDRSAYFRSDSPVTWTGTQLQFSDDIILEILNTKNGTTKTATILAANSPINLADGENAYISINRALASENVVPTISATIPAQTQATKDIIILGHRKDASGAGYLHLPLHKQVLSVGQTVRLGASGSGSGSGSGTGDDLNALTFKADVLDEFDDIPSASTSAVDITAGYTDAATYSAANSYYRLAYDARRTLTGTGVNMTISATNSFVVKVGDVIRYGSEVRRIVAVIDSVTFTIESAFSTNPVAAACTVSQAVYTKDLNTIPVDGLPISTAFSTNISQTMVDYEDTTAIDDKIFDANTTPVIAFTASANGTNFTNVQVRPTNLTDSLSIVDLPVAGTNMLVRFFSNVTNPVSFGFVNILKQKTFFHRDTTYTAGGAVNQAYCFTDGTGTEVNCLAPSVVSGKTRIQVTPWTYPVGINAGMANGSLSVHINGQKIPRFIDATLTPDAYYTEIDQRTIELDSDYSALNYSVDIIFRDGAVDNVDTNSSSIAALQDASAQAFQGFVNENARLVATTNGGSPAAGTFYSQVSGRASIPDISANLKVAMGVERIQTSQLIQIQNEFGPNSELVFGLRNDSLGLMRFVGNWFTGQGVGGAQASSASQNDFMEITFYGTGLNILTNVNGTAFDLRPTVDGGVEGANIMPNASALLNARGYNVNTVLTVVSGLALGVHTVKLRNNGTNGQNIQCVEILNDSTTIKVNPGSAYINGKKLVLNSQQAIAYNSGFESGTLGTRGGRVVVYQKADGTIAKSLTPVNLAQANLTSADHTNEEVVRSYHWREFGAARSDDFGIVTGSSVTHRTFTIDDDTTTLSADNVSINTAPAYEGIFAFNPPNFIVLTFVGTGLDVMRSASTSNTLTYNVLVDGTSIGTMAAAQSSYSGYTKVVSGLPYGTHVVKFIRNGGSSNEGFVRFVTYQPKKPSIPSGAVELADYNIMANFVDLTGGTSSVNTIATGVLRKASNREFTYVNGTGGTQDWGQASLDTNNSTTGHVFSTDRLNSYIEYTFFGTGFQFRGNVVSAGTTLQVNVDGVAANTTNYPGLTGSVYGSGLSYNTSTGIVDFGDGVTQRGAGFTVQGLPLGLHKIRINNNVASNFFNAEAIDVISPIHTTKNAGFVDLQNALAVGSNAITDSRKTSAIKELTLPAKAWNQAIGVANNPTTNVAGYVPMPDMSTTIKTSGGDLKITFDASVFLTNSGIGRWKIYVDGVPGLEKRLDINANTANASVVVSSATIVAVAAGVHKVDVYWHTTVGNLQAVDNLRTLTVEEI